MHSRDPLPLALEMMASLGVVLASGGRGGFIFRCCFPEGSLMLMGKEWRQSPWKVSALALPALLQVSLEALQGHRLSGD